MFDKGLLHDAQNAQDSTDLTPWAEELRWWEMFPDPTRDPACIQRWIDCLMTSTSGMRHIIHYRLNAWFDPTQPPERLVRLKKYIENGDFRDWRVLLQTPEDVRGYIRAIGNPPDSYGFNNFWVDGFPIIMVHKMIRCLFHSDLTHLWMT